jgi:hypothetical protein
MYDAMLAWLAVADCSFESESVLTLQRCRIPPSVDPATLPVLSFRLAQHAPQLQLPLEHLLLAPTPDGDRELCIQRLPEQDWTFTQSIILGTVVLQHFAAHFEMHPGQLRVGLAPKRAPLAAAERAQRRAASCFAQAQCTGQQRYVAAMNRCEQPDCNSFCVSLDEASGTCVFWPSFRAIFTLLLGGFAIAEMALHEAQHRLPAYCTPSRAAPGGRLWWCLMRLLIRPPAVEDAP